MLLITVCRTQPIPLGMTNPLTNPLKNNDNNIPYLCYRIHMIKKHACIKIHRKMTVIFVCTGTLMLSLQEGWTIIWSDLFSWWGKKEKHLVFVCFHRWLRAESNIHPLCRIFLVSLYFIPPFSWAPSSPTCLITIEVFFQTPPPSSPKETTCNYNCLPH